MTSLNVNLRDGAPHQRLVDVEVPVAEVERRLDQVARRIQRRAVLPGFRKGRVPLDLVRAQFAALVEQELIEEAVPELTQQAVQQVQLEPAVPPLVRNLRFQTGQPLRFEVQVDERPKVEARDYRGARVTIERQPLEEARVDEVLRGLQEDAAIFDDLGRPAARGDVVVLDSVRLDARGRRLPSTRARSLRVPLGAPDVLPDLENALLGAEAGQERTVAVNYPADYGAQDLAGKTVRYLVRVRKIQEKKLRPLDDNFAQEVFQLGSLEELRSRVRQNLEEQERQRVQRELEGQLSEILLERNPLELPRRLVDYTLEHVIHEAVRGQKAEEALLQELRERYRPGVERSLKREILLEAVARQEGLAVSEQEVAEAVDREAAAQPRDAARVRARYHSAERREALRDRLLEHKALEWLAKAADVEERMAGPQRLVLPASG